MQQTKSKAQQVAEALYQKINEQKMEPGERLPSERALADELACSRTSLREALKLLIAEGVLIVKRGSGIYVNNLQHDMIFSYEDLKHELLSLDMNYEFRLMFEPEVAKLAAQRATDEEAEALLKCAREIADLIDAKKDHVDKDKEFHELLARASHNPVVLQVAPLIKSLIHNGAVFSKLRGGEDLNITNAREGHLTIADFIAARDETGAMLAMRMHLAKNKAFINKAYD